MRRLLLYLLFLVPILVQGQIIVTGKVTATSEPNGLPGVNILVKGTDQGSITDVDGKFSIRALPNAILIFSFIGYKTLELPVSGSSYLEVMLEENSQQLGEVVVTGYSSVSKREITGSISSLKPDNFKSISLNGVDQALQGQVAGVQVTQSSGTPGGGIAVRIRGSTSISAGNRPLFIVDGIPVETGSLSARGFGGQNDNALALINPADIESMQVLKDASAKAMYGSRASNGVVVITTKRGGKNSPTKISFDVQRGIVDPVNTLKLLNSTQLLELQREAVTNAGQNPDAFGLIKGITDAVSTNWQDEVLRRGIMEQYQVTASGGDNNTTFYLSAHYRNEEGVQLNNGFERMGTTLNFGQQLAPKLNLNTNLTLSRSLNKRVKGDNFLDGVYSGAIKSLPYYVPYDENGRLIGPNSAMYPGFPNFNPVAQALLPRFETLTLKMIGGLNLTYEIKPNLRLKGQVSVDYNDITEDQYESSQTAIGGYLSSVGGRGYGVYIAQASTNMVSNLTLSYNKQLAGQHTVSGFVGTEVFRTFYNGADVQGRLFPSDDFTYIASAGIVDAGSSTKSPPGSLFSVFTEARYDFADKYLVTLGMRADGSSNFGPNNRFGYFPAISAGWRISNESFFKSKTITDLKLRSSIGNTGNERIAAFQFLGTWSAATYNGNSGVTPNNTANPNIKWESTREINIGVDAELWQGRLQTTLDVYHNKTSDLLLTRPYPFTTGFGGIPDNIGDMENKGIEWSATSVNITKAQLRWTTTVNLSKNLNKVLSLADSIPLYRGYTAEGVDATNIVKQGSPLGSFWGLNFLGVNPATGNAIYEDVNGDGAITNADAMVIGNSQPKLIGGITNTVTYKNFDASIFFQFSYGNKVLNFTKATLVNMGGDILNNQSEEALRRWRKPGDITDVPRYELSSTLNNLHSNRLLEDASYLRLKNVSIGYSIPSRIIQKWMIAQARIYVNATNLWTLTQYTGSDPEVSTLDGSTTAQGIDFFTLPQVRTISVGLNFTLR
ncbi:MAG: TonB-dependent receptor [Cyclobacteriaceae bacterium]|nr:TonB-dependent receptor [Cyclobacteriaceae bacterium]